MSSYFCIAAQAVMGEEMSEAKIVRSIGKITIVVAYKEIIKSRDFFIFQVRDMV